MCFVEFCIMHFKFYCKITLAISSLMTKCSFIEQIKMQIQLGHRCKGNVTEKGIIHVSLV